LRRPDVRARRPRRLSGWLVTLNLTGFAVVLAAGAVALIIAGYVAASRVDVDATTGRRR
jgi:hypothetical protein